MGSFSETLPGTSSSSTSSTPTRLRFKRKQNPREGEEQQLQQQEQQQRQQHQQHQQQQQQQQPEEGGSGGSTIRNDLPELIPCLVPKMEFPQGQPLPMLPPPTQQVPIDLSPKAGPSGVKSSGGPSREMMAPSSKGKEEATNKKEETKEEGHDNRGENGENKTKSRIDFIFTFQRKICLQDGTAPKSGVH